MGSIRWEEVGESAGTAPTTRWPSGERVGSTRPTRSIPGSFVDSEDGLLRVSLDIAMHHDGLSRSVLSRIRGHLSCRTPFVS